MASLAEDTAVPLMVSRPGNKVPRLDKNVNTAISPEMGSLEVSLTTQKSSLESSHGKYSFPLKIHDGRRR